MNELKLQIKSLLRAGVNFYDESEHPNNSEIKKIGKFITGNPIVRMEMLIDFIFEDYRAIFAWGEYNLPESIEVGSFQHENYHSIMLHIRDEIYKGIEFEVMHDIKYLEIRDQDLKKTRSEINRLIKLVDKWHYVKSTDYNNDHISNRISRILKGRIETNIEESVNDQFDKKYPMNVESEIKENLDKNLEIESLNVPDQQVDNKVNNFRVNQIALIYVYNGILITRLNASEIAAHYGFISQTSGEGLFQDYNYYSSKANRVGIPPLFTTKKLKNKIELFESITIHLNEKAKRWAFDEIQILQTILETEYS